MGIALRQPSDAYKLNTDDLYVADILNADTVRYDIASPSLGNYNDGNFNAAVGSQIYLAIPLQ